MSRAQALLVCLLILAGRPAPAADYALIIGVNDCPQYRLPGGVRAPSLRGAESDARSFAEMLMTHAKLGRTRVTLLLGERATAARVRQTLAELKESLTPADTLVVHFSGHGTQIADVRPLDEADGLDEALCLADSTGEPDTLLRDDEIGLWLDDLPAGRVTLFFDCCHSGTGVKDNDELASRCLPAARPPRATKRPEEPWRDLLTSSKSPAAKGRIAAFFACRAEQQAYERRLPDQGPRERSGQFTRYIIEALQSETADADRDRVLSRQELLDFVRTRLDATFNRTRAAPADRQEPQLETDDASARVF